jgi:hypothetical protein
MQADACMPIDKVINCFVLKSIKAGGFHSVKLASKWEVMSRLGSSSDLSGMGMYCIDILEHMPPSVCVCLCV